MSKLSVGIADRRGNLLECNEIAALLSVARNDEYFRVVLSIFMFRRGWVPFDSVQGTLNAGR